MAIQMEEAERRLANMEGRLSGLERDMGAFGAYLEGAQKIQERFSNVLEGLSGTITDLKIALVTMNNDIKDNVTSILDVKQDMVALKTDFTEKLADVRTEVSTVKKSVEFVNERGKFDFILFIKDHAVSFIIGGGLAYLLSLLMEAMNRKP